jgi:putative acyl-CoA dehydrogenase
MGKEPEMVETFFEEVEPAAREDVHLRAARDRLKDDLRVSEEGQARLLVERMALVLQGALLVRHSPPAVADAFCASRLAREGGLAFGTLPASADVETIIERARPQV